MNLQHLVSVTVKHCLAIGQALQSGAPCDRVDAMDHHTYDGSTQSEVDCVFVVVSLAMQACTKKRQRCTFVFAWKHLRC